MTDVQFTDPALQSVYTFFTSGAPRGSEDTPEAIAAREGLELAAELAAVRRRAASSRTVRRVPGPADRRRSDRRSLESWASTLLRQRAGYLRPAALRLRAQAWAQLKLWPADMEAWMGAVGVDGAAIAQACLEVGIALSAMDLVLDGGRVKQRLRGGESAASVLALAAASGCSLS